MKNRLARLLILSGILFSIGCKKDDDNSSSSNPSIQSQAQSHVQSGTWRITRFVDSGTDETANFSGYAFTFQTGGVLTAVGSSTYTGTWSITDSNSSDDSISDLDFNIYFNLSNSFQDLNDDWDFISQSATKIELIDVSGGNGGTDYLTFEKNP